MEEFTEKPEILICDCHSVDHQIVIRYDYDDNLMYCHIHMSNYGFFQRFKLGLKYIFGGKSSSGHWHEFIFQVGHAEKLKDMSDILKKNNRYICTE
tara:strand:- start:14138 stop:14425 length:288 start_codon:yes stop_codon:yes gene_type:complete